MVLCLGCPGDNLENILNSNTASVPGKMVNAEIEKILSSSTKFTDFELATMANQELQKHLA